MSFILVHDDNSRSEYGDKAKHNFDERGYLIIVDAETGTKRTYSPHAWSYIEELYKPHAAYGA